MEYIYLLITYTFPGTHSGNGSASIGKINTIKMSRIHPIAFNSTRMFLSGNNSTYSIFLNTSILNVVEVR